MTPIELAEPAAAALVILITLGLARWFRRAALRELRASLETVIDERLTTSLSELKPNGGKSMHDRLTRIEQTLAQIIERPTHE